ncbi:Aspartate aminotransferase like protein [Argiope bruennichi]|uniref:aspartate transaminase n=1 Tax=Argiope bruennichi TaxID=94029 RepID=A0A8T0ELZ6_ARGBR|nr:Aspartate aminotransferase like protein [Argiope bruennichi]
MSLFSSIGYEPPYEYLELRKAYEEDNSSDKIDLGLSGQPWVLPVIRKIEQAMALDDALKKEYCEILGPESFRNAATKMLLGENNPVFKEGKVMNVQALSGSGALRLGAAFLSRCLNMKDFYISSPSYPSYPATFLAAGFTNCHTYRYWDSAERNLDFKGMKEDLENAPEDSVVILNACAHNPTGVDPTQEQWKEIAHLMECKKLFPFFDCACQGFATGDPEKDSWPVRYFITRGFEMLCAQAFSKNLGLYSERIGNLTLIVNDPSVLPNCRTQFSSLVDGFYLTPPLYGARIVSYVLNDPVLFSEWMGHIKEMSRRIKETRAALKAKLDSLGTPGTWNHVVSQNGMFSNIGLSELQVKFLVEQRHIYLPRNSCINICGLNAKNIDYVANAIHEAVITVPDN